MGGLLYIFFWPTATVPEPPIPTPTPPPSVGSGGGGLRRLTGAWRPIPKPPRRYVYEYRGLVYLRAFRVTARTSYVDRLAQARKEDEELLLGAG